MMVKVKPYMNDFKMQVAISLPLFDYIFNLQITLNNFLNILAASYISKSVMTFISSLSR